MMMRADNIIDRHLADVFKRPIIEAEWAVTGNISTPPLQLRKDFLILRHVERPLEMMMNGEIHGNRDRPQAGPNIAQDGHCVPIRDLAGDGDDPFPVPRLANTISPIG